jgi:hypothetical protein
VKAVIAALLLAALPALAEPPATNDTAAGQALARQIRSAVPEERSDLHAALIVRAGGQTRTVPASCRVAVHDDTWETDYQTAAATNAGAERLVVIHRANGANTYRYARAPAAAAPLPEPAGISAAQAAGTSLAGSDFSLADLGLEFLHWPQQRQLKGEMRLGQPCYVLESRDPEAEGITRVKSYIDKESNGLLIAEGYDAEGHLIKRFSLHGSSFKKVNGHYQLEKMDIRNLRNHSQTELKYDMEEK